MRPPARRALAALLGAGLLALMLSPAVGQQTPESLLPPGFGTTPPAPESTQAAPDTAPEAAPAPSGDAPSDGSEALTLDNGMAAAEADETPEPPAELPDAARRSLDQVGPGGFYPAESFGTADGRYLATLMRNVQTPIASRWAEIVLRRMLLVPSAAPAGEAQADWVADRAALLLRLGEADGARMLVQGVDVENFSPRLRRVAMQAALATSDPAALCPLPDGPETIGSQPIWPMVRAFCAALSGDAATANATIGRGSMGDPIDHVLAEKLVAANGGGRRVVPIDWTAVDQLTDWRFGLATALNAVIPQPLLDAAPAWFQAWLARAPMLAAADRVAPARIAAALGPVSSSQLVDLYGRVMDEGGDIDTTSPAGRLRAAYRGDDAAARLSALHALWDTKSERDRYAASILTARAAAGIAPSQDAGDDAAALIAAMFAAGLDLQAKRWSGIVGDIRGESGDRAWAMLAVGAPQPSVALTEQRLRAFAKRAGDAHRTALLAAALAGLGRLPVNAAAAVAQDAGANLNQPTAYARALDSAVRERQQGTVAMLVATGLQSPGWNGVPAANFYRMIAALHAVGLDAEARMIAAEAMARTAA